VHADLGSNCFSLALVILKQPRLLFQGAVLILRSAFGGWYSAPVTSATAIMSFMQAVPVGVVIQRNPIVQYQWWRSLVNVEPYAYVCWVPSTPGARPSFARAIGASCRLLVPILRGNWALVLLPSKRLYLVEGHTYVAMGSVAPALLGRFPRPNAGIRRYQGHRPLVRGTVRNPNDHPHGGRTRAIRCPRTPWGRVAKRSRSPRPRVQLKALKKRRGGLVKPTYPQPYWVGGGGDG
jgi:hypothetical protein